MYIVYNIMLLTVWLKIYVIKRVNSQRRAWTLWCKNRWNHYLLFCSWNTNGFKWCSRALVTWRASPFDSFSLASRPAQQMYRCIVYVFVYYDQWYPRHKGNSIAELSMWKRSKRASTYSYYKFKLNVLLVGMEVLLYLSAKVLAFTFKTYL